MRMDAVVAAMGGSAQAGATLQEAEHHVGSERSRRFQRFWRT